jgi:hypothetical protein
VNPAATEAVGGVTAIEVNTAAVTVSAPEPLMVPDVAVMVELPCARLVANPALLTVAIVGFEDVQLAELVRFWVVPLVKVPVAVNCCAFPAATDAVAGVTAIDFSTAAVTVNEAVPLIVPDAAVMVTLPGITLVDSPVVLTVAIDVDEEVQVAVALKFCVVPLVKVPVAVNCCVLPAATDAVPGVTAMDFKTAAVTVSAVEPLIVPDLAVMVPLP